MRILIFILMLMAAGSTSATSTLQVFACEPEWAALADELGGELLTVFTATSALQDPHNIEARPALISRLRRADLLVCTGADLEAGWLPMLQRRSSNPRITEGSPGHFLAADFVELKEKPDRLDRADGDIHAAGNPHIQLDPNNIARVGRALTERLVALDPENAPTYQLRGEDFQQRWQAAVVDWEERARPLAGLPVVVAHAGWIYLEDWLGLERVAALEPKPGIPPSSRHLAQVLEQIQHRPAAGVLFAAYQDARPAKWLEARTEVPPVRLPYTVGGSPEAQDLFGLYEHTLELLLELQP